MFQQPAKPPLPLLKQIRQYQVYHYSINYRYPRKSHHMVLPIGQTSVDLVINITTNSGGLDSIAVPGLQCIEIDMSKVNFKFSLPSMYRLINMMVNVIVDYPNGYPLYVSQLPVTCTTVSPYSCKLISPDGLTPKLQTLIISIAEEYSSEPPPDIPIKLTVRGIDFTTSFKNLFPYNVSRTSNVVKEINYPPSGKTIVQDYQMFPYEKVNILLVENSNSFFYIKDSSQSMPSFSPYTLLQQNQTHSTYLQNTAYRTILSGQISPLILDNQTTIISNNYSSTYTRFSLNQPLSSNNGYDPSLGCFLGFATINISTIGKPVLVTSVSSSSALNYPNPYPYSYDPIQGVFTFSNVFALSSYLQKDNLFLNFSPGGFGTSPFRSLPKSILYTRV
ncbi:hypothetical protein PPL_02619 [Heterostelium album PN500]|uniref:Uncharacterized protein n=1 Tax=Heterostelium pallidum (strain ATCC 26659 / Pp 5 / PN500) TaxID=670386 RepID=D3B2K5_HETP5|nr:hypothetical protein PPL_02619 [Heterostelium album PN500]EFA83553.1 hypothetical protein PPL_02619 [Heterostelium album PN500]|eukprot:XP_020435670.1 hypothetical protein PPL_02619 [Heterostelium album PN500]